MNTAFQIDRLLETAGRLYGLVGPVGALLVVISVLSLTIILLKLAMFAHARLGRMRAVERALAVIENGGGNGALEDARALLARERHPIAGMMRAGLAAALAGASRARIEAAVRAAAAERLTGLSRYNRLLELVGLIAPLLGLLGTILGMISAFQALQASGARADPAALAGGIWEALTTTALGLAVAIPAIVAFNLAENRLDRLRVEAASALARFLASLEEHGR